MLLPGSRYQAKKATKRKNVEFYPVDILDIKQYCAHVCVCLFFFGCSVWHAGSQLPDPGIEPLLACSASGVLTTDASEEFPGQD